MGSDQAHLDSHCCQGRSQNRQAHRRRASWQTRQRRRSLHHPGGRKRCRPLRQDGAQRHRVHRYAVDLRGLPADERTAGYEAQPDERRVRPVERRRSRQLPDRNHRRHPAAERPDQQTQIPGRSGARHRWSERHRQMDQPKRTGLGRTGQRHRRSRIRPLPERTKRRACRSQQDPQRPEKGQDQPTQPERTGRSHSPSPVLQQDLRLCAGFSVDGRSRQGIQLET